MEKMYFCKRHPLQRRHLRRYGVFIVVATFFTNDRANERQGITWGNYINIDLYNPIGLDFKKYVLSDQMLMHEYGHSIDSQTWGFLYLLAIGIPSGLNMLHANSKHDLGIHDRFYTERLANFWAANYWGTIFDKKNPKYPIPGWFFEF